MAKETSEGKAPSVFTFVDSIGFTKENIWDEHKKLYVPFVVNRHFSFFSDTIMLASEVNAIPNADPMLQYHYLLGTVPARKRFTKWYKREHVEDVKLIAEFYNLSFKKAREALQLLSPEQLEVIRKSKGGLENEKRHL